MILGIIGTAGRGTDAAKLNLEKWNEMKVIAGKFIREHNVDTLISGGASYADHICVQAYLADFVKHLILELPCPFNHEEGAYHVEQGGPGPVSNLYHQKFHFNIGVNSLAEIDRAILKGATVEIGRGFKDRNTVIAMKSDLLLAYTFGDGEKLKEGGTADTMRKFLGRSPMHMKSAYHVDLHTMLLYQGAKA